MKSALRSFGIVLAALFMFTACGADAPDGGGGIDAGTNPDIDADLGCQGCIDVFGNCEPGDQNRDCGGGGGACETCLNGDSCEEGECLTPPSCTPENCAGCCDGSTCVVSGDQSGTQCGVDGMACTSCDSGICDVGVCKEACTPATCTGCCSGPTAEDCIEIGGTQSAAACGVEGAACAACGSGDTCTQGACVVTSCISACSQGCCDGAECLDGDSNNVCGIGGEACFSCGTDQTCSSGVCVVDPDSLWDFVIVSADVPTTNESDNAWDPFGGAPDVYIRVTLGVDSGAPVTANTTTIDNKFSVQFSPPNGEVVLSDVPASIILDSILLEAKDGDIDPDDLIQGIIDNSPPEALFGGSLFQLSVSGTTIRFKVVKSLP